MKKRFLVTSILMLLLTVFALSTSTYAWFSMNTEVSATGMQVKATTDQVYLQIVNANGTFNDTESQVTAAAVNAVKSVKPTAVCAGTTTFSGDPAVATTLADYAGGSGFKFAYTTSNDPSKYIGEGQEVKYSEVTTAAKATDNTNTYTLVNTFKIRLNAAAGASTAAGDLRVESVAFAASQTDAIAEAVSVLVVCGNYSQLWQQTALNTFAKVTGSDSGLTGANFADTTGTTVSIYVFINGQNTKCTTNNVVADAGYSVNVKFTVAE